MCGIAGYFRAADAPLTREFLRPMCDRIAHRGPDGHGEFFDADVALGHRRLSIIDVSGGAQPLGNEDGSIQIVFNGEIYNYRELQEELESKGHHFKTRSDTEVLVHLYEEEGERMPERLNGMFAFAIWDSRRRELFLARDRFGEKPLYYSGALPGLQFAFASELKALLTLPGFPRKLNAQSISDFLSGSYIPDPSTIYEDVFRLPAGHSAVVSWSGIRIRQYWSLSEQLSDRPDFERSVEQVRALSAEAVAMRLVSEVPLGGFLSGGVDSSAVVAYMAMGAPDRVKTFSIGFTEARFDELEYARMIVEQYKTEHHEKVVTTDVHDVIDELIESYDEPFGDPSAIPTLYLARLTRQHVTVALSGDGADEVFGGYRRYSFGVMEEKLRSVFPSAFRHTVVKGMASLYPKLDFLPRMFRAKATLTCLSQELGDAYFTSMSVFRDGRLSAILSGDMKRLLNGYSPREKFRSRFERYSHLPALHQMQAVDLETYLPGDILVKVDRATMAHSLESRAPWLDHRLAELGARLPSSFMVRDGVGK